MNQNQSTNYIILARRAVTKAREAFDAADKSSNPYARTMVTQILAEGDLISLTAARKALNAVEPTGGN